jgi:hypothetical protein
VFVTVITILFFFHDINFVTIDVVVVSHYIYIVFHSIPLSFNPIHILICPSRICHVSFHPSTPTKSFKTFQSEFLIYSINFYFRVLHKIR